MNTPTLSTAEYRMIIEALESHASNLCANASQAQLYRDLAIKLESARSADTVLGRRLS